MKIKRFTENIKDPKYNDYREKVTIPSFTVEVYLPEFYGEGVLDYGGPWVNKEVTADMIQLIKDELEKLKGIDTDIQPQTISAEYLNTSKWRDVPTTGKNNSLL